MALKIATAAVEGSRGDKERDRCGGCSKICLQIASSTSQAWADVAKPPSSYIHTQVEQLCLLGSTVRSSWPRKTRSAFQALAVQFDITQFT